jgi:hypothetical protein
MDYLGWLAIFSGNGILLYRTEVLHGTSMQAEFLHACWHELICILMIS